ncbi:AMP-binding protein [Nonomuraea sp. NPDC050451]|uniref:AMP-binding protein n=1 Tax=Nonomuraea sp. NPDC050451 TaxID=3364364 RepID=UPI0037932F01
MPGLSFEPLTPTSFLERSAAVFARRVAVVDGELAFTYAELWERVRRLAGGLAATGVRPGDRVAALSANGHLLLEATFGVPAAGAVLVPMNIRLSRAGRPGGRRASSTTTGAPTCRPWPWPCTPGSTPRAATCGPCPCSTATGGPSPGR